MRTHTLRNTKDRLTSLGVAMVLPGFLLAQVSLYQFSQTVGTYTEITAADGGHQLGTPTWDPPLHNLRAYVDPANPDGVITNAGYLAPAIGPGYDIGFPFLYNGDVFDRIGVAHGGWISFGKSEDGNQAVVTFTSDHSGGQPLSHSYWATPLAHAYQRNRIAGWGNSALRMQELSQLVPPGPESSLRVATVGAAPNRVCVIQWKNFRHNYSQDGNLINFQIRLNEADNSVEVKFGNMIWPWLNTGAQVGLGGQTSDDFNNRKTISEAPAFLYDWNATVAGTTNLDYCVAVTPEPGQPDNSGVPPVSGRTFKWTSPTCPPPAWPVNITEITHSSALVDWSYPDGADSFDYVVATIDDPADPNAVVEGNTPEVSAFIEGLEPLTVYYVFVRSVCGGLPGPWSTATVFRSMGGGELECGGAPVLDEYCYNQGDYVVWTYHTSNGTSPIQLNLLAGVMYFPNTLEIFYGPDTTGTPHWSSASGTIPGQTFTSTGPYITMYISAPSNGSCVQQAEFIFPLEWQVGCLDCEQPLGTFSIADVDCDANQYEMQVLLVNDGSSDDVIISNSQGVAPTTVTTTGTYIVGPFTAGVPVVITLENTDNELCNLESIPFINEPCVQTDCGPTDHTYCYVPQDISQWLYQGDAQPIGIRFRSGTMGVADELLVYQGNNTLSSPEEFSNNLANELIISENAGNYLLLALAAGDDFSCEQEGAQPWDYVVACYDGCTQPVASFNLIGDDENNRCYVDVTITEIGSSGAVAITNDGGAPTVNATTAGTYSVGPFTLNDVVRIEVEGASELCSWSSPVFTMNCPVGVNENVDQRLSVAPNPSNGLFRITLPSSMKGNAVLNVMDLQGRAVDQRTITINGLSVYEADLGSLPGGAYFLALSNGNATHTGIIQILH